MNNDLTLIAQGKIRQLEKKQLNQSKVIHDFINLASHFLDASALSNLIENNGLLELLETQEVQFILSKYHYEFILNLSENFKVKSVYVPTGILNPFIFWHSSYKLTYYLDKSDYHSIKRLNSILNIEFIEDKNQVIDLICIFPLLGIKEFNMQYNLISTSLNQLLVNVQYLNQENKLLVLFTERDFYSSKTQLILKTEKLYTEAVFTIPSNELDIINVDLCLVLISKVGLLSINRTFLGKIFSSENRNSIVLSNFMQKNSGKDMSEGILLESSKIIPLSNLKATNDFDVLNRKTSYTKAKVSDVMIDIKYMTKDKKNELAENSIYFSKIGLSKIATSPEELSIKTKNFIEVSLDSRKINNNYLMNYLNSKIGMMAREIHLSGSIIKFLSKEQIVEIDIVLPSLSVQNEMVKLTNEINNRQIDYDRLRHNIWSEYNSKTLNAVKREVNSTESLDKMGKWIDSLPYPLSITLWSYQSTRTIKKKIACLLFFFESLSEFLTMILISAYYSEQDFYNNYKEKWLNDVENQIDWYRKASFGQWNLFFSKLSKIGREMINKNEDAKNIVLKLLYYPSNDFLNIFNKEIIHTLNQTCDIRNRHKGHGGVSSETVDKTILNELEKHLNKIYELLNYSFEDTSFILPIEGRKTKGTYINKVFNLSGSKMPFSEEELNLVEMLDTDKMYMIHRNQPRALELIPLVKVKMNTGASYFYSSVESSKMRWISYHYEQEPELETDINEDIFKPFLR
ncbi:MAG: hypothetical protein RBR97_11940 [Bacteroidales bacterium]|jgi:hypothetical protein|nr:hypothetical protein [Bacteroidales bacterium]